MASLAVRGSRQLAEVSMSLRAAGSPTGLRRKLRRNLAAAAQPIKKAVQQNALAIPVKGGASTGLRQSIARASQVRVLTAGKWPTVRVWVNPARMPAGQAALPRLMEGETTWRHPVYGPHDDPTWVTQQSHPYFKPAVDAHLPGVYTAAIAAVDETAAEIERG